MGLTRWLRRYDIDRLDQRDPERVDLAYRLLHGLLERYFRAEVRGIDRMPPGAALVVGNHNALIMTPESFLFGFAVYRERGLEDVPYGLGHEWAIRLPFFNQIVVPLGAVRAGHGTAQKLFALGRKVLVFPGSDIDAFRSWWDRDRICFGGRTGYVRLALATGVPIVPMVAAGAQETLIVLTDGQWIARALHLDRLIRVKGWPIALGLPWGLMLAPVPFLPWPSRILIEVLPPIRFPRSGPEAAADKAYVAECAAVVEDAMQAALTRLASPNSRHGLPSRPSLEGHPTSATGRPLTHGPKTLIPGLRVGFVVDRSYPPPSSPVESATPALDALRGVKEGERGDRLYRAACSDRGHGASDEALKAGCRRAAHLCLPPYPIAEADRIAASAAKHPAGLPSTPEDARHDALAALSMACREVWYYLWARREWQARSKPMGDGRCLNLARGEVWASDASIAKGTRIPPRTIARCRDELKAAGLLEWRDAAGRGNVFRFPLPARGRPQTACASNAGARLSPMAPGEVADLAGSGWQTTNRQKAKQSRALPNLGSSGVADTPTRGRGVQDTPYVVDRT